MVIETRGEQDNSSDTSFWTAENCNGNTQYDQQDFLETFSAEQSTAISLARLYDRLGWPSRAVKPVARQAALTLYCRC